MLNLTFYGGVGHIGGNKVLLRDGPGCLFFDFGTPYALRERYFEEYLKPRPSAGLLDLLELELLPPLNGVYRPDLLTTEAMVYLHQAPELNIDGVLVSHAHLDHSGYVSFLREDIPIYTTSLTAFIAKAMEDSGGSDFEREICYLSHRALVDNYLEIKRGEPYNQRCFTLLDGFPNSQEAQDFWAWSPAKTKSIKCQANPGSAGRIGSLSLRHFPVDHSVLGAAAFAVETSQGWVGYSGDLRLHGHWGWMTEKMVKELRTLRPFIFIGEGTRAGDTRQTSEEEVYENALRAVRSTAGKLVVADFGPRNVERLLSFHRIAQSTQRQLVILARDAYLLDRMSLASAQVPRLDKLEDVLVYEDRRLRRDRWEEHVWEQHSSRKATPTQIGASPGDFIICFSLWDINDLIDIGPRGGLYIYSSSEAYDEEQQLDIKRLNNWLQHFGMVGVGLPRKEYDWHPSPEERGFHASGHASGPDLVEIVHRIGPRYFIPIHTEKPEYFIQALQGTGIEVCLPTMGLPMEFP